MFIFRNERHLLSSSPYVYCRFPNGEQLPRHLIYKNMQSGGGGEVQKSIVSMPAAN
jgi:hypothetical protein